ncbi:hypothetical protein TeGR_g11071, partial [Tetraparma gracilis]
EMELPKSEYTYLSDKPFAKGGSGNFVYYIKYDGVKAVAKEFPLDGLDSGDREVATSGFKKELSINYLLPENPNLVRLIGCTTSDPTKNVMIMEFVERGSLRDVLDDADTQLTTEQQLKILMGVAKGMAYMYAQEPPIQHRDLKSLNILLADDFTPKISDFGLSKSEITMNSLTVQSMATSAGGFKGTVQWSAPEVLQGEGDFTVKADVFSFAVVVFEVLTRERPFKDAKNMFQLGKSIWEGVRPSPLPTDVHPKLEAWVRIMQLAWAQKPDDRPTFQEVIDI